MAITHATVSKKNKEKERYAGWPQRRKKGKESLKNWSHW